MPLGDYIGRRGFQDRKPSIRKTRAFHGINRSLKENSLQFAPECWTHKGVNFDIVNDSLKVRNNYEAVMDETITAAMNDLYNYEIKSMHVFTAGTEANARLLVCVEAKLKSTGLHHHYCMLHRKKNFSDNWAEVKCNATHSLGGATDSMWLNTPYTRWDQYANYSGDFYETGLTVYATIMTNGDDPALFYTPSGIGILGSSGWKAVSVNTTTNTLTATGLASLDDRIQFYSRTQEMPGGIEAWTAYYAVNVSGNNLQISLTQGGAAIDLTGTPANLVGRVTRDFGLWTTVGVDSTTSRFTAAGLAVADTEIMFTSTSNPVNLPRGIGSTRIYKVVNVDGSTFQVTMPSSDTPDAVITFTSNGTNVKARTVKSNPADAPKGEGVFIGNDRVWMYFNGHVAHNAGYYDNPDTPVFDGKAHPNDWTTSLLAGTIPLQEWDGDTIKTARSINGQNVVVKKNIIYEISGDEPPFVVRPMFSAKGTIAPQSVCWHHLVGMLLATPEGIVAYNGAQTRPYAVNEIQGIWSPDNEGCIAAVVGDRLFAHGNFYHPVTGNSTKGLLVVDFAKKNIMFWNLALGETTLTVDCVLDPRFTTIESDSDSPEFWFACGDQIYRPSESAPGDGEAVAWSYYMPDTDYGAASIRKHLSQVTITGSGGALTLTPIAEGVTKTAKTFNLPSRTKTVSVQSKRIQLALSGSGDAVVVTDLEQTIT